MLVLIAPTVDFPTFDKIFVTAACAPAQDPAWLIVLPLWTACSAGRLLAAEAAAKVAVAQLAGCVVAAGHGVARADAAVLLAPVVVHAVGLAAVRLRARPRRARRLGNSITLGSSIMLVDGRVLRHSDAPPDHEADGKD